MTEEQRTVFAKLIDEAERTLLALQDGPLPQGDLPGLHRAIGRAKKRLPLRVRDWADVEEKKCNNPQCFRQTPLNVDYCCRPCRLAHEGNYSVTGLHSPGCEDDFTSLKIPTFDEAMRRFDAGEATPLDEFIYDNEPADPMDARDFREGLQVVIDFVLSHKGSAE